MKTFKTLLFAGLALMLPVGVVHAVDLDDLDVTIRVIDSDDINDISHELSLPFPAPAAGREHADGGLSHARDARGDDEHANHESSGNEQVAENAFDERGDSREPSEDEAADRDESREDIADAREERDDAKEQEQHENEQEEEDERKDGEGVADPLPEIPDIPGTPGDK